MTESDEEQESMSGLFTDESYSPHTFHFGAQSITVLSLEASSTDYDLTGQIVWPGAQLMSDYICSHADMFKGKRVLEVGSGVGLNGLLCARFCPVVMTDHNETVLKVMGKNVALQQEAGEAPFHDVDCMLLEWGNEHHLEAVLARYPTGFDYILGADICYQQASVPLLFQTVRQLLDIRIDATFILAYVSRIKSTDALVVSSAEEKHLSIREISGTRRRLANDTLEGWLYEVSLTNEENGRLRDSKQATIS